jgi:hypothetical protein
MIIMNCEDPRLTATAEDQIIEAELKQLRDPDPEKPNSEIEHET